MSRRTTDDPRDNVPGLIYLLHFNERIGHPNNPRFQAEHYMGWTEFNLMDRLSRHMKGDGAAIMRALRDKGIGFQIAWAIPGTRNDERKYKRTGHFKDRLCRICINGVDIFACPNTDTH